MRAPHTSCRRSTFNHSVTSRSPVRIANYRELRKGWSTRTGSTPARIVFQDCLHRFQRIPDIALIVSLAGNGSGKRSVNLAK